MTPCANCDVELSDDGRHVLTLGGERDIPDNHIERDGVIYRFCCGDCAREWKANNPSREIMP